jgi:hypothetical protein
MSVFSSASDKENVALGEYRNWISDYAKFEVRLPIKPLSVQMREAVIANMLEPTLLTLSLPLSLSPL